MALDIKSNRKLGGGEMGNISVDLNSTFQSGSIAKYDANGAATPAAGASSEKPCGVFKWNKASTLYGVIIREAATLAATGSTVTLAHATVSSVKVENLAGADYTVTTDYTVNATNGTITGTGGGIAAGETVYVTYTFEKTAADIEDSDGKNFFNTTDDTAGSGKVTLLQGNWRIYTDQFDTGVDYTVNAQLYVTAGGKFSTATGSNSIKFGKCVSIPTASNAYLGVEGDLSLDAN